MSFWNRSGIANAVVKTAEAMWAERHHQQLPSGFRVNDRFGQPARAMTRTIQRHIHAVPTGIVGPRVVRELRVDLEHSVRAHEDAARAAIHAAQQHVMATLGLWRYGQVRPIPDGHRIYDPTLKVTDCSGVTTMLYQVAGAPDPQGQHYDGQGFTGSTVAHCRKIALDHAKVGDIIVFYRPGTTHHEVTVYSGAGSFDPLCFSFGSNPPRLITLGAEAAAQRSEGYGEWDAFRIPEWA